MIDSSVNPSHRFNRTITPETDRIEVETVVLDHTP